MRAVRKNLSNSLRFDVLKHWQFRCFYCGAKAGDVELHIDHVIPVSKGGTNDFDNLVPACKPCNSGKLAKLLPTTDADDDCMRVGAFSWPESVPVAISQPDREEQMARTLSALEAAHEKTFEMYADLSHLNWDRQTAIEHGCLGLQWAADIALIRPYHFETDEEYEAHRDLIIDTVFASGEAVNGH